MATIPKDVQNGLKQEYVKKLLDYDPETGIFTWSKSIKKKSCTPGKIAGSLRSDNSWRIRIDNVLYHAHRLAWIYVMGEPCKNEVDHINRIRYDNRWCNLREATRVQNQINVIRKRPCKSGYSGVDIIGNKYRARSRIDGKTIHLGMFNTAEEAYNKATLEKVSFYGDFVAKPIVVDHGEPTHQGV